MGSDLSRNYQTILKGLKNKIRQARQRAVLTVNTQLLAIYLEIGRTISEQEKAEGWGAKIVESLAKDLKAEFPDMMGLSARNLRYMRDFANAYPPAIWQQATAKLEESKGSKGKKPILQHSVAILATEFVQLPIAQLPWGHNCFLLDKLKTLEDRLFYATKAVKNGWSREVLGIQIQSGLHLRQGNAITNFEATLPQPESDLARETLKNPYLFDFIGIGEEMQERDLEKALIQHIKHFMLELGRGFAYVGNQYNLKVEGDDYFLDLLFYNYHLRCFVVFELKVGEFKPEFAGKLNFYINTIDEQIKGKDDKNTIGVLLCKTPNETVVKFALKGIKAPIGVADYELAQALPKQLKGEMPTIEELEQELEKETEKLQRPVDQKLSRLKELLRDLKHDEVKEKRSPETTSTLFNKVVLPLKKAVASVVEGEISSLFENSEIMIWVDSRGLNTDKAAKDYFKEHPDCREFKVEIRLRGFKKAGTQAFDRSKRLEIYLSEYKYSIGMSHNPDDVLLERLYHQIPTKEEINALAEKMSEALLDDITRQVEYIRKQGEPEEKKV